MVCKPIFLGGMKKEKKEKCTEPGNDSVEPQNPDPVLNSYAKQ